jgi:hypothetical protein
MGARFDGTLQMRLSDGTSMRFERPSTTCVHCRKASLDRGVQNKYVLSLTYSAPGGRKPPLMAEVGQSILREHNIGIVRFMQAKELRGLQGCMSGRKPAGCSFTTPSITLLSRVKRA